MTVPLTKPEALLHYVKCHKYSKETDFGIVNSPDLFLEQRKGSRFEHVIYLSCLMSNFATEEEYFEPEKVEEKTVNETAMEPSRDALKPDDTSRIRLLSKKEKKKAAQKKIDSVIK